MKTVIFLPGHEEDLASRDYTAVVNAIESKGYRVLFLSINWRYTNIDKWVKQLNETYVKYDPKKTILAGFSFGAMTAFMAATKRNPAELWLFSLSPYFKEDIPALKPQWKKAIGKRKIKAFSSLNFMQLAKTIDCRVLIFIGSEEAEKYPRLLERAEDAHRKLFGSKLIYVPDTTHDIAADKYIAAIAKEA